ncbi:MAG: flagellar biosynthesis protein FlhA [Pseudomonadota bacterium]
MSFPIQAHIAQAQVLALNGLGGLKTNLPLLRDAGLRNIAPPLLILMMLAMIAVPLPPILLDLFFTFNITLSMMILLLSINMLRPLDFGAFPSVLLISTLLRLALNIASTRVVLLHGHEGNHAAGKVIQAFGEFVIGGNFAIGLVVFAILIIINFVVVTKGAGRVAEVSARFTLDAMPGKQMAIDADLNAGLLNQQEAKIRREDIQREADFYGAMDGSMKFVRGDATAGMLIMFINIVGGLFVGMIDHGMPIGAAMKVFTMLTVGDGLVAQIPSLFVSIAAAIIVTRIAGAKEMGAQVTEQMFTDPRALALSSVLMGFIGLVPGMPNFAFLSLAAVSGIVAWYLWKREAVSPPQAAPVPPEVTPENKELSWDDVPAVDRIGLEVGYRLIPLVDRTQGGQLMGRIKGVRRKLSQDLGFLVHSVHIRDNLDLGPNAYRIILNGVVAAEAEIHPDRELAINPGRVFGTLAGIPGHDPAFGLEAVWIEPGQRDHAQTLGYTVVDASTVVATHLSEVLQSHAHVLLGHEEVQQLLDTLGKVSPKLVEDLPKTLPLTNLLRILQNLLEERVPIRDMRTIVETLAEHAPRSQDTAVLTAAVRTSLSRAIVQQIAGTKKELPVVVLDPSLEQILHRSLQGASDGQAGFEPGLADRLQQSLTETQAQQERDGLESILLVPASIRPWMSRFVRHSTPGFHVLSYNEIPDNRQIRVVANIGRNG